MACGQPFALTWSFWWLQWRLWGNNPYGIPRGQCVVARHQCRAGLDGPAPPESSRRMAGGAVVRRPSGQCCHRGLDQRAEEHACRCCSTRWQSFCIWNLTRRRRWRWYGLSLAAFLLALLSKTAVVMLPVVLLGCVWWLRGPAPIEGLCSHGAILCPLPPPRIDDCLVSVSSGSERTGRRLGGMAFSRLAVAGLAPWFYLAKALLPLDPWPDLSAWNPGAWGWSGCLPGIALAGVLRCCGGSATVGAGLCCLGSGILS